MEYLIGAVLIGFVCGLIAISVGGKQSGCLCFCLGLLLGPIGVIVAAIMGNRSPEKAEASGSLYGPSAGALSKGMSSRRIILLRRKPKQSLISTSLPPEPIPHTPPEPIPTPTRSVMNCPLCSLELSANNLKSGMTYTCPHCKGMFKAD